MGQLRRFEKVGAYHYRGMLRPVYHGEHGLRTLRELGRSYQTISRDLNRVINRIKALYRGWSIPCAGTQIFTLMGAMARSPEL